MAPYTATLSRHYTALARCRVLHGKPFSQVSHSSHVPEVPVHLTNQPWSNGFSVSCRSSLPLLSLDPREMGVTKFGSDRHRRYSAVSDAGFGDSGSSGDGSSGGGGGGGGGGNGGADSGNGGNNWSLLSWYLGLLAKFPVLTKAITSALLTLIGDLICQIVIDKVPSLDIKRSFLFSFLGMALVGPTLHFWYLYLSKLVTIPGVSGALIRLLLDQFIFAPIFIGVFLSSLVALEGRPSQVVPKLQQEWFSSVLANWQLWIPFQFLNFRFVPQPFQVLAANIVSLVWNVILSFKAHKEILPK